MKQKTYWIGSLAAITFAVFTANTPARAEPLLQGKRVVTEGVNGGLGVRAGGTLQSGPLDAAGQRRFATDGQGNVAAGSSGAFSTANGVQGKSSTRFTRNADGSASGTRNTSATNSNTGVSFDGSTTYTKGEGVTRSGSCTDASGNTVTCGSAR